MVLLRIADHSYHSYAQCCNAAVCEQPHFVFHGSSLTVCQLSEAV